MTKHNRRSPEEIIAATTAKLEAMKLKQAVKDAKDHPVASLISDQIATVEKQEREAKKGFGDGPQSFDSRIRSHELWIDEINAAADVAELAIEQASTIKDNLRELLSNVTADIANGVDVDISDVQVSVDEACLVESESLDKATLALDLAQYERNAYNVIKRQPKKVNPSNNMEATA